MAKNKKPSVRVTDGRVGDKLLNIVSGLGTGGDKATHTHNVFVELTHTVLSTMYAANWMAKKTVDLPVDDMFSVPREVSIASMENTDGFTNYASRKKVALDKKAKQVLKWSRLFGGAAIIIGVEGAGKPEEPLNIDAVPKDGLQFLHVVSRHKISIQSVDKDAMSPTYGEPLMFRLQGGQLVHGSRVVPVKGLELPEEVALVEDYWGVSIMQYTEEPINQTSSILAQLASMVYEANVDTVAVKGLSAKLANKDGQRQVIERFKVGNMMKSTHQMMLYDMDMEEYARNPMDIGKFPEMVPTYMSVVAGATGIPATRFLGKSPDGMNASGNSDDRMYLDKLADMQEDELSEIYDRVDPIILMSAYGKIPEDWEYEFPNLWNIDAKDEAEVNNKNAMTDQVLLTLGAIEDYHITDRVQKAGIYPSLTEEYVSEQMNMGEFDQADDGVDIGEDEDGEEFLSPDSGETTTGTVTEKPTTEGQNAEGLPGAAPGEDIQKQALNGAQIASLVNIATAVAAGELDRETAIAIVMVSVPGIQEEEAGKIVGHEDEDREPAPVPPMIPGQVPVPVPTPPGTDVPDEPEEDKE